MKEIATFMGEPIDKVVKIIELAKAVGIDKTIYILAKAVEIDVMKQKEANHE